MTWGVAQAPPPNEIPTVQPQKPETTWSAWQRRQYAKDRLQALLEGRDPSQVPIPVEPQPGDKGGGAETDGRPGTPTGIHPSVNIDLPNFAYSPNIRKFIDALPGVAINPPPGDPSVNGLGQYIPIAIADPNAYDGADYYEIAVVQYSRKMHTDLPPTDLRGYVQLETAYNAPLSKHIPLTYPNGAPILRNGAQVYAVESPQYLGPRSSRRRAGRSA